ncbi:MAG: transporter substrate-binding domain-containing protein [Caldilineaceae bacterium]
MAVLCSGEFVLPLLRLFGVLVFVIVVADTWFGCLSAIATTSSLRLPGRRLGRHLVAAVTVTTVGYGDKTPRGRLGRAFALFWMFAGLFIIANFTASVTTRLTVQQIQGAINGPQDLPGKVIVTVEGSTAATWLTEQGIPHRTVATVNAAYPLLDAGQVQAVVYDYPVLRYHALNFGEGRIEVVGAPFNREDYGIAFPTGSPLREEVNRALLHLREDGTYDQIYAKWFGRE